MTLGMTEMAKTWQHLLVPLPSCDQGRNTGIIPNDGDNPAQRESSENDEETQSYAKDNHSNHHVDGISLAVKSIVTSPARSWLISTCQNHHTSNKGTTKEAVVLKAD